MGPNFRVSEHQKNVGLNLPNIVSVELLYIFYLCRSPGSHNPLPALPTLPTLPTVATLIKIIEKKEKKKKAQGIGSSDLSDDPSLPSSDFDALGLEGYLYR